LYETVSETPAGDGLTAWIARLLEEPTMLSMGHNQRLENATLGLGWLYYAVARMIRPRHAVVIGSYRGFVPLLIGRAFQDELEEGQVTFLDPSMVDDFWRGEASVRAHFDRFGIGNVRHFLMTTQEFVVTREYRELPEIGLLFVDGYHTEEQARFDYHAFEGRLARHGIAMFHDTMGMWKSTMYGVDRAYQMTTKRFIDELKADPGLQVLDLPFGTGLTMVRKASPVEPLIEGRVQRPAPRIP
jgi:predicted O-methyltransferase YrrM